MSAYVQRNYRGRSENKSSPPGILRFYRMESTDLSADERHDGLQKAGRDPREAAVPTFLPKTQRSTAVHTLPRLQGPRPTCSAAAPEHDDTHAPGLGGEGARTPVSGCEWKEHRRVSACKRQEAEGSVSRRISRFDRAGSFPPMSGHPAQDPSPCVDYGSGRKRPERCHGNQTSGPGNAGEDAPWPLALAGSARPGQGPPPPLVRSPAPCTASAVAEICSCPGSRPTRCLVPQQPLLSSPVHVPQLPARCLNPSLVQLLRSAPTGRPSLALTSECPRSLTALSGAGVCMRVTNHPPRPRTLAPRTSGLEHSQW